MTSPINSLRRIAVLMLLMGSLGAACAADLTVSAASSLSNAFKALAPAFEAQNPGTRLLLNFAASDVLLAQISKGAPADVFASADQETMDRAEQLRLLITGSRRNFAGNSLVLVTPLQGGLPLKTLADLQKPEVKRIALGKPEGVPAGRYAKRALEAAKLWTALAPKAVYAQNVRQALDYVARGEVDAGFVYATDAAIMQDKVKVVLDVPLASPVLYPIASIKGSSNAIEAKRLVNYLQTAPAQAILARYGFKKP